MKPNQQKGKIEGERRLMKITMPPNATKAEIKKYIKEWKFIIKTFEKLTGTEGQTKWLK